MSNSVPPQLKRENAFLGDPFKEASQLFFALIENEK
jgi:hypothetical protein